MKKVFLGGTCNNSDWRQYLIPLLKIDYFNPVVDDWTPEAQKEELRQRKICDYCLYTITPKMKGVYSIAEVVDDSNKKPDKTVLCVLQIDGYDQFDEAQMKSLSSLRMMVESNGVVSFDNLSDVARYLNSKG